MFKYLYLIEYLQMATLQILMKNITNNLTFTELDECLTILIQSQFQLGKYSFADNYLEFIKENPSSSSICRLHYRRIWEIQILRRIVTKKTHIGNNITETDVENLKKIYKEVSK